MVRDTINTLVGHRGAAGEPQDATLPAPVGTSSVRIEAAAALIVIDVGDARVTLGGGLDINRARIAVEVYRDVLDVAEAKASRQGARDACFDRQ